MLLVLQSTTISQIRPWFECLALNDLIFFLSTAHHGSLFLTDMSLDECRALLKGAATTESFVSAFFLCLALSPDWWHHHLFVTYCVLQFTHPWCNNEVKKKNDCGIRQRGNSLTHTQMSTYSLCNSGIYSLYCLRVTCKMKSETAHDMLPAIKL